VLTKTLLGSSNWTKDWRFWEEATNG